MKLLPHQAVLLDTCFSPSSKRIILLRGDVGLGKSAALVALAGRLLQEWPTARVLFLVPFLALRSLFVEMLGEAGTPTLVVDRYRFREMLDTRRGTEFWPTGVTTILSLNFAEQPDVLDSLTKTRWDLVIADEAHSIMGTSAEVLQRLAASAERVILATATIPDDAPFGIFPAKDVTVVEWRRDLVVDHEGKPLYPAMRSVIHEIPFSLNAAELNLRATISSLCEILKSKAEGENLKAMALPPRLESSPVVLESALLRLSEVLKGKSEEAVLRGASEKELLEERLAKRLDRATAEKAAGVIAKALQEVEAISSDSKLGAFGELLSDLSRVKAEHGRICVVTPYVSTLYYLSAEIEGRGMAYQLLRGSMGTEDRRLSLTQFSYGEKVLVATTGVMTEGLTLAEVTDLIMYDIPCSKNVLHQILGRFERLGRLSQLNVYVFRPSNSDSYIAPSISLLREALARH